jgi:hypothetical protein
MPGGDCSMCLYSAASISDKSLVFYRANAILIPDHKTTYRAQSGKTIMALVNLSIQFISMLFTATGHGLNMFFSGLYNTIRFGHLGIQAAMKGTAQMENAYGEIVEVGVVYCFLRSAFWMIPIVIGGVLVWGFGGLFYAFTWGLLRTLWH